MGAGSAGWFQKSVALLFPKVVDVVCEMQAKIHGDNLGTNSIQNKRREDSFYAIVDVVGTTTKEAAMKISLPASVYLFDYHGLFLQLCVVAAIGFVIYSMLFGLTW